MLPTLIRTSIPHYHPNPHSSFKIIPLTHQYKNRPPNFIPQRKFWGLPIIVSISGGVLTVLSFIKEMNRIQYHSVLGRNKKDHYLVRYGPGKMNVSIAKSGFVWPHQEYRYIDTAKHNYKFNITIPTNDEQEILMKWEVVVGTTISKSTIRKYLHFLEAIERTDGIDLHEGIQTLLEQAIIELSSQKSLKEIIEDREEFQKNAVEVVQKKLANNGLTLYNHKIIKFRYVFNPTQTFNDLKTTIIKTFNELKSLFDEQKDDHEEDKKVDK